MFILVLSLSRTRTTFSSLPQVAVYCVSRLLRLRLFIAGLRNKPPPVRFHNPMLETSDVPKGGARGPWPLPERPQGAPQATKYFFLTLDKTFIRNKN